MLLKASAGGITSASAAVERLVTRAWLERLAAMPKGSCGPPTVERLAKASRELEDFVVLDAVEGKLTGRLPTSDERDDLAYFLASISANDTAVGESGDVSSWTQAPDGVDRTGDKLWKAWLAVDALGDDDKLISASRELLAHQGYPGKITTKSDQFTWGGAPASSAMRGLAAALERRGQFDEAAQLYRRANPGGGACGTSASSNWENQVQGLIRSAESGGHCEDVIVERLLGLEPPYDASVLAARGFDLRRLYRGAQLARNRSDRTLVDDALNALAEPLQGRAKQRLATKGLEDWDGRVNATAGLIAQLRPDELPGAAKALRRWLPAAGPMREALVALAKRARHSDFDPCVSTPVVAPSGAVRLSALLPAPPCETRLTAQEEDAIAAAIVALPVPSDWGVGFMMVRVLGAVASPVGRGRLEQGAKAFGCEDEHGCGALPDELEKAKQSIVKAKRHGAREAAAK